MVDFGFGTDSGLQMDDTSIASMFGHDTTFELRCVSLHIFLNFVPVLSSPAHMHAICQPFESFKFFRWHLHSAFQRSHLQPPEIFRPMRLCCA